MTRVGSLPVLLCAAVGLQACVPWPSRVTVAPEIVGVVREAGRPLTGAAIYYAYGYPHGMGTDCTGIEVAATTDLEGRFSFEEVKEFRFFLTVGDPIYPYIICVERAGQPVLLWSSQEMGYVLTPVGLECELTEPVREGRAAFGPCAVRYPEKWNQ